ncbi:MULTISPECIES: ATP-binding protein [unclassified Streptomyces]|uniref:ATP-binding protein n=1 Tax=unclassified Streptomyces TaxID=2593676 RepID=UPI00236703D6|nr:MULTISPECIES: ATP-binding protein [unclassified Streptomyces]MDF3141052.1 ATP-binding protein [Streptomyces sp. T21Q-yed]WDF45037.1 ATP-binding protein [Streptomyces sp. T12]
MKVAIRHVVDNIVWSTSGTVWAIWHVTPQGSRYMDDHTRDELLDQVTSLVRSLPGEARLFGLCARVDPGEVVARTVTGIDYRRHPYWAEVAEAQLHLLAGEDLNSPVEMYRRTLWLAVPLEAGGARAELSAAFASAWAEIAATLGLPPAPVPAHEVEEYQQRARQLLAELGGGLALRPARPAEIVWMHQHAVARGLDEPLLTEAEHSGLRGSRLVSGVLRAPTHADLGHVRLLEGGFDEDDTTDRTAAKPAPRTRGRRKKKTASLVGRRWLQVESEAGCSYQAHLVLAEMPRKFNAVSGAFLARLDQMPFGVDWVVDMRLIPTEKVVEEVRKKKRDLVDQAEQYSAQRATGLPEQIHDAAEDLGDLDARAARTSVEVEVQAVTAMTVWADTADACDRRARALQTRLRGDNYRLLRPVGGQEELFTLTLPATQAPAATRLQYTQHELGEDWAMHGAFSGHGFGDPTGAMIGFSQDVGTVSPILLDIANAPRANASASFGIAGDLGGGKSVLLKLIASSVVDRGGRVIAIDRTKRREWAAFAQSAAPGRSQVVDAARAELSIDPLRVFDDPAVGARYALSYLTVQLGLGPLTEYGALLKKAVTTASESSFPCMAQVIIALEEMAAGEGPRAQRAASLVEWLAVAADEPLAAAVFDPDLPPLDMSSASGASSDFVVITTAGLTLPPREAVTDPELMRNQPLEALIGRAVLYLIAAIARETAFTDARFTLLPLDEAYWLTSSAEGQALVDEIVYDGRKHGAGVGLGCHDVRELGNSTARGLLAYRFLSRTADPVLAARGLEWLGLPGDDEALLRMVTKDLSPFGKTERAGEILGRDPRMQIGRFKVLVPNVDRLLQDIFTTPEDTPPTDTPALRDELLLPHATPAAIDHLSAIRS